MIAFMAAYRVVTEFLSYIVNHAVVLPHSEGGAYLIFPFLDLVIHYSFFLYALSQQYHKKAYHCPFSLRTGYDSMKLCS